MKEYSTIELNDLARKYILSNLKAKDQQKHKFQQYADSEQNHDGNEEVTTKNYVDQLMSLEEDPVGTPRPNVPDNNVIVLTTPATTT